MGSSQDAWDAGAVERPVSPSRAARIRTRARELGFSAVAFARADEPLERDHERYLQFVAAGRHGTMGYLANHREVRRRLDHPAILEGARTVVCLARRYDRRGDGADPPLARGIARYARGRDYHGFLKKRLVRLARFVRDLGEGVRARALCDTAPVLERAWAARAGLGFIGKNGLLIVPGQGSYCLLGEVVTDLELEPEAYGAPASERCGSCRACLDACPTEAFAEPWVLEPRRCISYLTIEHRAPPSAALRTGMGEHLFGCDRCQEVCPYNAPASPVEGGEPFAPLERWSQLGLGDLVGLDAAGWARVAEGTPVKRATRVGLAKSALVVAANRLARDPAAREVLERGLTHDDAGVRELARELLEGEPSHLS